MFSRRNPRLRALVTLAALAVIGLATEAAKRWA
jgi:hypothetical protein